MTTASRNVGKAQGQCGEPRHPVEAVLTIEDGNAEPQEIVRSCGAASKPVAVSEPTPVKPKAEKVEKPEGAAATPKPAPVPVAKPEAKTEPAGDDIQA